MILPNHKDILKKASDIASLYVSSIQNPVEICIWGFCPQEQIPFIGTVRTMGEEETVRLVVSHEYCRTNELTFVLLGSHNDEVKTLITDHMEANASKKTQLYWRSPIYVVRELITSKRYEDVSGNLQLCWISENFQITQAAVVVAIPGTNPTEYTHKYRNIDYFTEIGQRLGPCLINLPALEIDFFERSKVK